MPTKNQNPNTSDVSGTLKLLTKKQLVAALGLRSTRIIDSWTRKRMIPVIVADHRTRLFDLEKVKTALAKFERKAVGQ